MKKISPFVCFALFALLLLLSPSVSAASFEMQVFPSAVSACPCSAITPQDVQVSVKNLYQYPDTFTFVLEAPPGFTSQIQPSLTLNPGATGNLDLFLINAVCTTQPGSYKATVKAKSGTTGDSLSTTLDLEVLNCYEVQFNIESKFKEMCTEENRSVVFDMVIENKGKYSDTYDLTASVPWASFSDNPVTIDAGKSKSVGLALTPPQDAMGLQNINVLVSSQRFYSRDSETVQLSIQDCYQMAAELQPNEVSVCLGEIVTQKLTVSNLGIKADAYSIAVPNWVAADRSSVSLDPKNTAEVNISLKPTQKGRTYFNLTVSSARDPSLARTLPSIVDVSECRGVAIIISPAQFRTCQGVDSDFSVSVKNLGTIMDIFSLNTSIGSLESANLTLNPGETKQVRLVVSDITAPGSYKVKVAAQSGEISDEATADLEVENCYSLSMDISPQNHSACADSVVNYTIALKNTGKLSDEYTLTFENSFLNTTRQVTLASGEARMEYFSVNVPTLAATGTYPVKAAAKSGHASLSVQTGLSVKSKPECYSVQLTAEQEKLVELCKAATVPVSVKNTGERKDSYKISFEGPQWVYLSPDALTLSGGQEQQVYLYFSPCFGVEKGVYPVKVKASSSNVQSQAEIAVGVVPNITAAPPVQNITNISGNVTPVTTGNVTGLLIGWDSNTWKIIAIAIITIVIIIILAIRFVLLVKK